MDPSRDMAGEEFLGSDLILEKELLRSDLNPEAAGKDLLRLGPSREAAGDDLMSDDLPRRSDIDFLNLPFVEFLLRIFLLFPSLLSDIRSNLSSSLLNLLVLFISLSSASLLNEF